MLSSAISAGVIDSELPPVLCNTVVSFVATIFSLKFILYLNFGIDSLPALVLPPPTTIPVTRSTQSSSSVSKIEPVSSVSILKADILAIVGGVASYVSLSMPSSASLILPASSNK